MGKRRVETKKVTLDIGTRSGARKLVKLREDGWEVVSEHKRGPRQWNPRRVDFVLSRTSGGTPAATNSAVSPPPVAPPAGWYPDPHHPSLNRWWDGQRWTEHTYQRV